MTSRRIPIALLVAAIACGHEEAPAIQSSASAAAAFPAPAPPPKLPAPAPATGDDEDHAPPHRDTLVLPVDTAGRLRAPVHLSDACQGEDCQTSFDALICKPTDLRAAESDSAPVTGHVQPGDSARVLHANLHVQPGLVVVRRDTLGFTAGDSLRLLRYYELGEWQWWIEGRTWSGSEFWRGPAGHRGFGGVAGRDTTGAAAVAIAHPVTETWFRVKPATGAAGWWRVGTPGFVGDALIMDHWGETCAGYVR